MVMGYVVCAGRAVRATCAVRATAVRVLGGVGAVGLLLGLAACSAPAERPSVAEVSAVFVGDGEDGNAWQELGLDDAQVTCLAQHLVDSDLSDELLRALADTDESFALSAEDEQEFSQVLVDATVECITAP